MKPSFKQSYATITFKSSIPVIGTGVNLSKQKEQTPDIHEKVLNYLKKMGKGRIELDLNETAKKLSITREDLEKSLFYLQRSGALRIVRIPLSKNVEELLKNDLMELDGLYLAKRISREEYMRRWGSLVEITVPRCEIPPLSPVEIRTVLDGLNNILTYLERLNEIEVSDKIRESLKDEYNREIIPLAETLGRLLNSALTHIKTASKELEDLHTRIELVKVDSKIRELSQEEKLKDVYSRVEEILNGINNLMELLVERDYVEVESAEKLSSELKELEERKEILNAKLLIERKPDLEEELRKLEKRIEDVKSKIKAKSEGKNFFEVLEKKLTSLKSSGLLRNDIFNDVKKYLEVLRRMTDMYKRWNHVKSMWRKDLSSCLSFLKELSGP